jgi:hypothetical protein
MVADVILLSHRVTNLDFSSHYEQIRASPQTAVYHTIGLVGREFAPRSTPQGSASFPISGQLLSNSVLSNVNDSLVTQLLAHPRTLPFFCDPQFTDPPTPSLQGTYEDKINLNFQKSKALRSIVWLNN